MIGYLFVIGCLAFAVYLDRKARRYTPVSLVKYDIASASKPLFETIPRDQPVPLDFERWRKVMSCDHPALKGSNAFDDPEVQRLISNGCYLVCPDCEGRVNHA